MTSNLPRSAFSNNLACNPCNGRFRAARFRRRLKRFCGAFRARSAFRRPFGRRLARDVFLIGQTSFVLVF